jgi:hypothetical protein
LVVAASVAANEPASPGLPYKVTASDGLFLDDVQRRAVLFFEEQTDEGTGLTLDRAPVEGTPRRSTSSVAATGFGLTAWCIADARGWFPAGEAKRRTRETLRYVLEHHDHEHGWFYHFVEASSGKRVWHSEASTIDTALFMQGALLAREYLRDPEVTDLVNKIYARIDWRWALNGGRTVSHGWRPENGFIVNRWDSYSELLGLYLLGIGAPKNPLPAETWDGWRREPRVTQGGRTFIQFGPLFTHQYAHAWFDFRGRRDAYADYWQNSVDATFAQREWSAAQRPRFEHWSNDLWGLTASDSSRGYVAWGTPMTAKAGDDSSDGTVVPCAPGGSLPFAPAECLTALRRMREVGGDHVWGRYGFVDAFNPQSGWTSPDVIAIDVGITLIMAENLRTELIWQTFMRAPEVVRALELTGLSRERRVAPAVVATIAR